MLCMVLFFLETGLSMNDEYYAHESSRENLQHYINSDFILTDNNWE